MKTVPIRFLALSILFVGGCYRYVPAETGAIPPGTEVRVRLTDAGQAEIRQYYGPDLTRVTGSLVRWDVDGLGLMTEMTITREGFPATFLADTIQLLPQHLSGVDVKEFDGKRSLGFTAGVIGAMAGALVAAQAFGGSSSNEGDDSGGPDPEASILLRVPLIRLPLGLGFR
jgi:hypothetical protein